MDQITGKKSGNTPSLSDSSAGAGEQEAAGQHSIDPAMHRKVKTLVATDSRNRNPRKEEPVNVPSEQSHASSGPPTPEKGEASLSDPETPISDQGSTGSSANTDSPQSQSFFSNPKEYIVESAKKMGLIWNSDSLASQTRIPFSTQQLRDMLSSIIPGLRGMSHQIAEGAVTGIIAGLHKSGFTMENLVKLVDEQKALNPQLGEKAYEIVSELSAIAGSQAGEGAGKNAGKYFVKEGVAEVERAASSLKKTIGLVIKPVLLVTIPIILAAIALGFMISFPLKAHQK
jgi:hypothetical protein